MPDFSKLMEAFPVSINIEDELDLESLKEWDLLGGIVNDEWVMQ